MDFPVIKLDILYYISDPENWGGVGDNHCRYSFTHLKKPIPGLQKHLAFLLQLWCPVCIAVNFPHPL